MVFQFRIWGLALLFMLMIFIFWYPKKTKDKNSYPLILIATYLLEFIYIICYIKLTYNQEELIWTKIYYILFSIILLLHIYYVQETIWKEKYKLENNKLEKKLTTLNRIILVIVISITCMIIFIPKKDMVWNVVQIIALITSIIQLIILTLQARDINKRKNKTLYMMVIMELGLLIFQFYFKKVEVLETGQIIIATYLYFTLENKERKYINELELERNYALKNLINKESFLKKLSHEIRIPIGSIDGFSQIIEQTESKEELKESAKDIRLASRELIDLINSMIDLSIIESGNLEILKENYNIYDTIEDLTAMLSSRLKSKNITFTSEIEKDIPEVLKGDSDRIRQILLNILSNSIKYTDKGKITLSASSVKSNSLCRLIIKIKDTGRGMTKEEMNNIFTDEQGIGLKIADYLTKLMNGKIDIESEKDKGTEVTITIDQEIVSQKEEKRERKEKIIEPISLKGNRVLLVDDNNLNLKVASKLLLPYEVEVVNATSGQECLDILDKDNNFNLILMDDLMPNLSGTETLDILRKIERVSGYFIPVVALTANATTGMKEKYIEAGFDDYLKKPIEKNELDRVLKKYLKK